MPLLIMSTAALLALTTLVAAFVDGGDLSSRLPLILLHPLCVAGLLTLAPSSRFQTMRRYLHINLSLTESGA